MSNEDQFAWFPRDEHHILGTTVAGDTILADYEDCPYPKWCWDIYNPAGEYLYSGRGNTLPPVQLGLLDE